MTQQSLSSHFLSAFALANRVAFEGCFRIVAIPKLIINIYDNKDFHQP